MVLEFVSFTQAIQEVVNSATPEEMELALNASLKRMSLMKEDSHSTGNIFPEGNGQMTGGMEGVSRAPNGGPATSKAADALQKLKVWHGSAHSIRCRAIRFLNAFPLRIDHPQEARLPRHYRHGYPFPSYG